MVEEYILQKSDKPKKKFVILMNDGKMKHYFGNAGSKDFTLHDKEKREARKKAYIARHEKRENWKKSGIHTSGFWSRWLLWNKPTIEESIKDVEKRFNVKIKYKK